MKPSLEHDFTVSVRHQVLEELPDVAEFYQGIYSVTLNFLVSIMFVPEFERNVDNWPTILPENVDNISTKLEARLFTVALSNYIVTPNSLLAGQQELIPLESDPEDMNSLEKVPKMGVIFYVNSQEFAIFSQELSDLADQTLGVHDYVRISAITNLKFAKLILSNIILSPHFSKNDLKILNR